MTWSAAISASVTGDPSALPRVAMVERLTARMAAPAFMTSSVSGSISATAVSRSITGPARNASLIDMPHAAVVPVPIAVNQARPVLAARAPAVYQALKHA